MQDVIINELEDKDKSNMSEEIDEEGFKIWRAKQFQ